MSHILIKTKVFVQRERSAPDQSRPVSYQVRLKRMNLVLMRIWLFWLVFFQVPQARLRLFLGPFT